MTKMEEVRILRMMRLGCVMCSVLDIVNIAQECHHIVEGNRRLGDWFTLPLCRGHHQGDWTIDQKRVFKPAELVGIYSGSKVFEPIYGTERELWELIQERLGLMWPASKVVPRRVA